jgi:lipopolysaccharide transport protein LptA/LPS export ABC transporter protein LptC
MVTDLQRNTAAAPKRGRARESRAGAGIPDIGSIDRSKAFRQARRHTLLVRLARISLPVLTVALFAGYVLFAGRAYEIGIGDGKLSVSSVALSSKSITAENPHFEGFNKDGDKFVVKAKSAEHDLKRSGPISLKLIEGTLFEPQNAVTTLHSPRGTFDSNANVLELEERIDVKSNSGLSALLTRATVLMKENKIVSAEPVTVEMPSGVIRGNELVMFPKARQARFSKGVTARFKPEAADERAGAAKTDMLGKGDEPIDVTSDALDIDDGKRLAVFTGSVRAVQGKANLTAAELEVGYEAQQSAATRGSGRIKRIVARQNVVIIQADDRATSAAAEFDPNADTALLSGDVVVTQGLNELRGERLFLDRKSATSQLSSPPVGDTPKGRIHARLHQKQNGTPGKGAANARPAQDGAEPFAFKGDPNAPIEIEADQLDVDDRAKTAVFRGDVLVTQSDHTIQTAELVAVYTGESGLGLGSQGQGARAGGMQLKTVRARQAVHIRSKDGQTGKGQSAEFDVKANIVTLVGNVVLTQGGNTVTGPRAVMNLNTGESQIVPDAVHASEANGSAAEPKHGGGRPSLLLYPNQAKDKAKRGGVADPAQKGTGSAARTSGWTADTAPAGNGND